MRRQPRACPLASEAGIFTIEECRHDLARRTERLDAEIDALVYELYGLTEEEIGVVEATDRSG